LQLARLRRREFIAALGGAVAMWFMNGLQITSSLIAGTAGTDWIIQRLNAD
jgi:hypothetical protein